MYCGVGFSPKVASSYPYFVELPFGGARSPWGGLTPSVIQNWSCAAAVCGNAWNLASIGVPRRVLALRRSALGVSEGGSWKGVCVVLFPSPTPAYPQAMSCATFSSIQAPPTLDISMITGVTAMQRYLCGIDHNEHVAFLLPRGRADISGWCLSLPFGQGSRVYEYDLRQFTTAVDVTLSLYTAFLSSSPFSASAPPSGPAAPTVGVVTPPAQLARLMSVPAVDVAIAL